MGYGGKLNALREKLVVGRPTLVLSRIAVHMRWIRGLPPSQKLVVGLVFFGVATRTTLNFLY